ncbi:MAG: AFG1 family ATPase [Micavibrio sp.]|nr:MAG: AFG1 family ATPase [Micavibrio sp.]
MMSKLPEKPFDNILEAYDDLLRRGGITADPQQRVVAEKFAALQEQMTAAESGGFSLKKMLSRFQKQKKSKTAVRQGIYLYGGVGRGKSFLMDMFFETVPLKEKTRLHFHDFMLKTHEALHGRRRGTVKMRYVKEDILADYAAELAAEYRLLCFDELFVRDIADAMILGRLFTALFDRGVAVVFTSNFAPEDLYKNGLQRELFLPFIAALNNRLEIVHLEEGRDYRLDRAFRTGTWFAPLLPEMHEKMREVFHMLTEGRESRPVVLKLKGREMTVKEAAGTAAWLSFAELCEQPRGAADYLALCDRFDTLLLSGVPQLTDKTRNETRRFMTLVDTLYERGVRLAVSAETEIAELYNGKENAFEFQRTQSRLMEMQSEEYWQKQAG